MTLSWSKRLATGLDWQDLQHQELFKRVNHLLDAMTSGRALKDLGDVFMFLESYVVEHFGDEENFMKEHKLPDYAVHKAAHEDFVKQYSELRTAYVRSGASSALCMKLQTMLTTWLISHIGGMDKGLANQTMGTR